MTLTLRRPTRKTATARVNDARRIAIHTNLARSLGHDVVVRTEVKTRKG